MAGAFLLLVYSLGLGIPFIIAGVFVGTALRAFARIRKHLRTIQIICGVLLVIYGALLLGGQFGWLGELALGLDRLVGAGAAAVYTPSLAPSA